jgi:hypothetical protein
MLTAIFISVTSLSFLSKIIMAHLFFHPLQVFEQIPGTLLIKGSLLNKALSGSPMVFMRLLAHYMIEHLCQIALRYDMHLCS